MKFKEIKLTVIFEFIITYIFIIILFLYLITLTGIVNKLIIFKNNNISIKYSSVNCIQLFFS